VTSRIAGTVARLAVSETADLSAPIYFPSTATSSDGIHLLEATGLLSDLEYFYAVEDDGVLDTANPGRFRTHAPVGTPYSHTVAWIGDAGQGPPEYPGSGSEMAPIRVSNHPCFTDVQNYRPTMQVHVGDVTYYDPGSGVWTPDASLLTYRTMWTDVFNQSRQRDLYRNTPTEYVWDDHCYGPNDSDGTFVDKANAAQAARERWGLSGMPEPEGAIYRAWIIGRIQYVLLDTRYFRTPNVTPDGPGKTMLGASQKAWLEDILRTSTAEVLVLTSPTPWVGAVGGDTWSGFLTERAEIGALLVSTGWAPDRMVFATGDIHKIGVGDGTTTPDGAFPILNTGAIDAGFSADFRSELNLFHQGGTNQWTSIEVIDSGETITLRLLCWVGSTTVFSHQIVYDTSDTPTPTPLPPSPGVIAVPVIRQLVTWLGVHQTTGQIIAEIPDITGEPQRQLSAYANSQLEIPLAFGGNGYVPLEQILACTDGANAAIVCVINDLPLWMGIPTDRVRGSGPVMNVPTATPEGYLVKRRERDHSFVDEDRALVAFELAQYAETLGGQWQGLGLEYDVELTGDLVSIDYKATDRTTIYDAIRALCEQGLEFEIAFDWADASQTRVTKILRIKRRIGRVTGTPAAMFDTDAGSALGYTERNSWQTGKYANHVVAIAPGQGEDQPASTPAIDVTALDGGAPVVELVIEPGNNITSQELLDAHAEATLQVVRSGSTVIEIEAALTAYPRLGVDCLLGDMVSHRLSGPGHRTPLIGERRMTGWSANPKAETWTPRLVEDPLLVPTDIDVEED
jgi:alkaline phosphatase D